MCLDRVRGQFQFLRDLRERHRPPEHPQDGHFAVGQAFSLPLTLRLGARIDTELLAEQFQPGPLGIGPIRQRGEHVVNLGDKRRRAGVVSQVVQHGREPEHDLKRGPRAHPQPASS